MAHTKVTSWTDIATGEVYEGLPNTLIGGHKYVETKLQLTVSSDFTTVTSGNDITISTLLINSSSSENYTYKFIVYNRTTNSWGLVQAFGTANTCVWKKGSVGVRDFYVDVKDSNGTVVRSRAMTITINTQITPKPVITSSASEVKVGDKITLKVSSGDSTCSYKVIVYNKSTNQWGKIQDFGKNTTINWTAGSVGDREFYVDVKDAKGKVTRSKAVQVKVASRIIINTNVTNTNGTYTLLPVYREQQSLHISLLYIIRQQNIGGLCRTLAIKMYVHGKQEA